LLESYHQGLFFIQNDVYRLQFKDYFELNDPINPNAFELKIDGNKVIVEISEDDDW
jgi:hypothetical protein